MPEIATIHVNPDELDKIIKENFSNSVAILEKWFCSDIENPDFFNDLSEIQGKISDWDKGRVFDDVSEIRWERKKNGLHLVWIKDKGIIPDGWNSKESLCLSRRREVLLWGERINDKEEWYEKQVPRVFEYPVKGKGSRVYVVINEYILKDGSSLYRFKEVIAK